MDKVNVFKCSSVPTFLTRIVAPDPRSTNFLYKTWKVVHELFYHSNYKNQFVSECIISVLITVIQYITTIHTCIPLPKLKFAYP